MYLYVSVYIIIVLYVFFIHLYLHVSISLYLHASACNGKCLGIRKEDTTQAETVCGTVCGVGRVCAALIPIQIKRFYLFSKRHPRQRRLVSRPDHGPRFDVLEQGAARPRSQMPL